MAAESLARALVARLGRMQESPGGAGGAGVPWAHWRFPGGGSLDYEEAKALLALGTSLLALKKWVDGGCVRGWVHRRLGPRSGCGR